LDKDREFIERLIDSIPDAVATGKAVQKAAKEGQTSLDPTIVPTYAPVISFPNRVQDLPPKEVRFVSEWDDETTRDVVWKTDDRLVSGRVGIFWYKQDARSAAILTYKPRKVQIFWDGEPDKWNEWR
jgi:hypothetical protein